MDGDFARKLGAVTAAAVQARRTGSFQSAPHPNGVTMLDVALYGEPAGADYAAELLSEYKQVMLGTAQAGGGELTFNTYAWGSRARQGFADELMKALPGLTVTLDGKTVKVRWPGL